MQVYPECPALEVIREVAAWREGKKHGESMQSLNKGVVMTIVYDQPWRFPLTGIVNPGCP